MKILVTIILLVGALFLPASKGLRDAAITAVTAVASGVERLVMRGDYAEIRLVDGDEFDAVVREPGRLVIVVVQKELTASSRSETHELDHAMKELPGKVLIAKVVAERNTALMTRLKITRVPEIHVYRGGVLLRKFDATVDKDDFTDYIHARLEDKPSPKGSGGKPDIRPMSDDWLPPGVEKKQGV